MANNITYSLTPVSTEFTGGPQVFRANVKARETLKLEELAKRLGRKTKQDSSLVRYFLEALDEELAKQLLAGNRVNLGQISTGFAIRGSFQSEDDRFDPKRHSIVATVRTLEPLRSALADVTPDNITLGLDCSVYSLMDAVTHETNAITGTNEQHIQGVNLGIDTENDDEGVKLLDAEGNVVAVATVSASNAQTINCTFPAIAAGAYTLVVSCRNGARATLAPATAKLAVIVKAAS